MLVGVKHFVHALREGHDMVLLWLAVALMDSTLLQWGLTIGTKKTNVLVVSRDGEAYTPNATITIGGATLDVVLGQHLHL